MMEWSFETVLDEIHEASSEECVLDVVSRAFKSLGTSRFIYIFMPQDTHYNKNAVEILHRGFTGDYGIFLKQFEELARTNAGSKYMKLKAASYTTAFTERDHLAESLFTSANQLKNKEAVFWDRGASLIIPVHSAHSNTGFFFLSRRDGERNLKYERKLQWLCHGFHQKYCELWTLPDNRQIKLTKREQEVLLWVSLGNSNSVVAKRVSLSRHTIDSHLRRIFLKLGVNDCVSAVIKAHEIGLLQEDIIQTSKAHLTKNL